MTTFRAYKVIKYMKYLFTFFCAYFLSVICIAQDYSLPQMQNYNISRIMWEDTIHENQKKYFKDSTLALNYEVSANKFTIRKEYYPSGNIKVEYPIMQVFVVDTEFIENEYGEIKPLPIAGYIDVPVGLYKEYLDSKRFTEPIVKGQYVNGQKEGTWKRVLNEYGISTMIAEYKKGQLNGIYKEYYGYNLPSNSKIRLQGEYKNDLRIGDWTKYEYQYADWNKRRGIAITSNVATYSVKSKIMLDELQLVKIIKYSAKYLFDEKKSIIDSIGSWGVYNSIPYNRLVEIREILIAADYNGPKIPSKIFQKDLLVLGNIEPLKLSSTSLDQKTISFPLVLIDKNHVIVRFDTIDKNNLKNTEYLLLKLHWNKDYTLSYSVVQHKKFETKEIPKNSTVEEGWSY